MFRVGLCRLVSFALQDTKENPEGRIFPKFSTRQVLNLLYTGARATASISTKAPFGKAPTWTVERAG